MKQHSTSVLESTQGERQTLQDVDVINCSVGIMAYNEEANIGHTIRAVLEQQSSALHIGEIIVVASGCTDRTVPVVAEIAQHEPRVRLCIQEKREGKASAINLFLKHAVSQVVVLIGADVIPEEFALEALCTPLNNPKIGMVGGRPVPVNDPATFMGHAVHLLWHLHDRLARVHPKLGEVIAFRNVISGIPPESPVDEISIQALISQLGYQTIYEPTCIVYNKGPLTIRDFLKQRRRIYAGHLLVRDQQNYAASTMKVGPILRQLLFSRDFAMRGPRQMLWTLGTIFLEGLARVQGHYDYLRKHQHHIWEMVDSTKALLECPNMERNADASASLVYQPQSKRSIDFIPSISKQLMRRVNNTLSVIIFRFMVDKPVGDILYSESEEREVTEVVRKYLPLLRTRLRKEGDVSLSISGPGVMTAVIRAEQLEAERISSDIQAFVQATPVRIGVRGREIKVTVAYSSLTFAFKASKQRSLIISSPLMQEAMVPAQVMSEGGRS